MTSIQEDRVKNSTPTLKSPITPHSLLRPQVPSTRSRPSHITLIFLIFRLGGGRLQTKEAKGYHKMTRPRSKQQSRRKGNAGCPQRRPRLRDSHTAEQRRAPASRGASASRARTPPRPSLLPPLPVRAPLRPRPARAPSPPRTP